MGGGRPRAGALPRRDRAPLLRRAGERRPSPGGAALSGCVSKTRATTRPRPRPFQAQLQLLALARLLRNDLREWARLGGADHPRPRAVVFTSDAAAAVRVGAALRDSLWGEQAVATRAGEKDGEVGAAAFKSKRGNAGKDDFESVVRAGGASVLVVPRAEGRGLDFPDVTHVYCFNLGARRTAALASPPPLAGRP